eukprot:2451290-Rhodomonas_salina.1
MMRQRQREERARPDWGSALGPRRMRSTPSIAISPRQHLHRCGEYDRTSQPDLDQVPSSLQKIPDFM